MAANIDHTTGKAAIAFLGSRNDVWHRMGQEMTPNMSTDQWAAAAGLDWEAAKVPAFAELDTGKYRRVDGRYFIVRLDNGTPLGYCSDQYQIVQPRDVLNWFEQYISVDERFQLDVAGALDNGATIWATATYRDRLDVAGEAHLARVLMTTSFDGSGATINQGTMTRVVCQNTLKVATADKRCAVRTTHRTKFDAAKVGSELARLAQGFVQFKAIGDALAQNEMSKQEVSAFFKECLDIPLESKVEDLSARKVNQFHALAASYRQSVSEGAEAGSAWAALNAITRYVDHDRGSKNATDLDRFNAAQFGGGALLKDRALSALLPRIKDKVTA